MSSFYNKRIAYVVGVALGDGNLSNPNGRAVRLRITCDNRYPEIIENIVSTIQEILPQNKVSIVFRTKTYCDISCYSNQWETILPWKAKGGSKYKQKARVPKWIFQNKSFCRSCLQGLFETDGSIYHDRGYLMANFVTIIPELAHDVSQLIETIGFQGHTYRLSTQTKPRFNIRISKKSKEFIDAIGLRKNMTPLK